MALMYTALKVGLFPVVVFLHLILLHVLGAAAVVHRISAASWAAGPGSYRCCRQRVVVSTAGLG